MTDEIKRLPITPEDMENAVADAIEHFTNVVSKKGNGAFVSSHEMLGVLSEEVNKELLDAIHERQYGKCDDCRMNHIYQELNDVVATALFGMACIKSGKMTC